LLSFPVLRSNLGRAAFPIARVVGVASSGVDRRQLAWRKACDRRALPLPLICDNRLRSRDTQLVRWLSPRDDCL
jgi:hypothetical protein